MTRSFKRVCLFVLSLLMITTMVGCDTPKTDWSKLSDEEKIDKVLQSFERMKNGEIHIVASMYADVIDPKEGADPVYKYEAEFIGAFELRPDRVSGKESYNGNVKDYYCDRMFSYEKNENDTQWLTSSYSIVEYNQPIGIQQDVILYFETIKDQLTLSEDSDTITVHYETDDIDFLYANDVQLIWSSLGSLGFSSNDKSGKLEIDLKMSKDNGMPVSVTITGVRDSDFYKNQKYVSEVTYSKVNSGIHVDIPSGIDNPIYQ